MIADAITRQAVDRMTMASMVGRTVLFRPGGRLGAQVEAKIIRWREDPRGGPWGWFDTRDAAGAIRSVRPGQCTLVESSGSPADTQPPPGGVGGGAAGPDDGSPVGPAAKHVPVGGAG